MGRERDYGSEYDRDKERYPEYVGGSSKLEKAEPQWMEFKPVVPVPEGHYERGMVYQETESMVADNPFHQAWLEKQKQEKNKQGNPTRGQRKTDSHTSPTQQPKKKGFWNRLFGGRQENQSQKQPQSTQKKQNPYAAPRSQNLKKQNQDTPTVANFKQQVKNRANAKLDENSKHTSKLSKAYTNGKQSKPLLTELRGVVRKDGQLEAQQQELERELALHSSDPVFAGESGLKVNIVSRQALPD